MPRIILSSRRAGRRKEHGMHEVQDPELDKLAQRGSAPPRLKGRIALVTGASRGLGRFFAEALAREGAQVILAARSVNTLQEVAARIERAGGASHCVEMDVGSGDFVSRAIDKIVSQ